MSYTPSFTPQYENGWKDRPDTTTPVIAAALNAYDDVIQNIESYLAYLNQDFVEKDGDIIYGDLSITQGQQVGSSKPTFIVGTISISYSPNDYSVSFGEDNVITGINSFCQGTGCHAEGDNSHGEGNESYAIAINSHAEGDNTEADGDSSHSEGYYTTAGYAYQHVSGKYNDNKSTTLFEVGNGTSMQNKSNAFEVYANGNVVAGGDVTDGNGTTIASLLSAINALTARVAALEGN